ncbi:MAG: signal peptidase II [Synergistaceae bacterium]|nr:signal peptidase II [Candidatus Equadaptatus faecalis]
MTGKRLLSAVLLIAAGSFAADFLTKRYALSHNISITANRGISFGFLAGKNAVPAFSFIALLFIFVFVLYFFKQQAKAESLASALMFGGALGNLYDRLVFGNVIDWFSAPLVSEISGRAIFMNAADVFIIAGFAILTLSFLRKTAGHSKKQK